MHIGIFADSDPRLDGYEYRILEKLSRDEVIAQICSRAQKISGPRRGRLRKRSVQEWKGGAGMSVKWTEERKQKVIDLRNRNILVSAAAGSG